MKTVLTVIAVSFALFGVAAGQGRSGTEELEQEKGFFFTGNDVHSLCQFNRSSAQSYTAGVWDHSARTVYGLNLQRGYSAMVDAAVSYEKDFLVGYCEPPRVTAGQVTDVFCAYLRDKPEKRNVNAALLFMEAMQTAWPCRKP
jgi:Rap1a immunity proteins